LDHVFVVDIDKLLTDLLLKNLARVFVQIQNVQQELHWVGEHWDFDMVLTEKFTDS